MGTLVSQPTSAIQTPNATSISTFQCGTGSSLLLLLSKVLGMMTELSTQFRELNSMSLKNQQLMAKSSADATRSAGESRCTGAWIASGIAIAGIGAGLVVGTWGKNLKENNATLKNAQTELDVQSHNEKMLSTMENDGSLTMTDAESSVAADSPDLDGLLSTKLEEGVSLSPEQMTQAKNLAKTKHTEAKEQFQAATNNVHTNSNLLTAATQASSSIGSSVSQGVNGSFNSDAAGSEAAGKMIDFVGTAAAKSGDSYLTTVNDMNRLGDNMVAMVEKSVQAQDVRF